MIKRNNIYKKTAIALAVIAVFGSNVQYIHGYEGNKTSVSILQYVDKLYEVDTILKHATQDKNSSAHTYLKSSEIEMINSKMYMTLVFTGGDMIKDVAPVVDGNSVEATTTLNGEEKTITFEIPAPNIEDKKLNNDIKLNLKMTIPVIGQMNVSCRVMSTFKQTPEIKPEETPEPPKEEITPEVKPEETPEPPKEETKPDASKDEYKNGYYKLKNTVQIDNQTGYQMVRNLLNETTTMEVKDGRIYITFEMSGYSMMGDIKVKVDGQVIKHEQANIGNDSVRFKIEIPSISSDIKMNMFVKAMSKDVEFGIGLDKSSVVFVSSDEEPVIPPVNNEEITPEVKPEETPEPPKEEIKPDTSKNETNKDEYKNGYYKLKNTVQIDNQTGYQMVRNLLNETTTMEVKDGRIYITFEMSGYSMMGDIKVKVDGQVIKHEQANIGNDSVRFKIEIPSISSDIKMNMFVKAMSKNVEFGIGLDKSSVVFVSSNEEPIIPPVNNETTSESNDINNSANPEKNSTVNDKIESVVVKGKLYTIKNEIVEDNPTGKEMARKYLDSTTKIEEVDGKMYATLTFSGMDLMKNHKITVNGAKVNHQIVAKGSDSISIRFAIPNLDADINVALHVIPMGSDIDFGVKLLKDTLTFVKEIDLTDKTLPQTGSLLNNDTVMMAGTVLATSGLLSKKKKRK